MIRSWDDADRIADDVHDLRNTLIAMRAMIRHCEMAWRGYDLCGQSWNAIAVDMGQVERAIEQLERELDAWHAGDHKRTA